MFCSLKVKVIDSWKDGDVMLRSITHNVLYAGIVSSALV